MTQVASTKICCIGAGYVGGPTMAMIAKQIDELNEWERDVVFPLAQAKVEIDLDDGVKANYPKFGAALKKIPSRARDDRRVS